MPHIFDNTVLNTLNDYLAPEDNARLQSTSKIFRKAEGLKPHLDVQEQELFGQLKGTIDKINTRIQSINAIQEQIKQEDSKFFKYSFTSWVLAVTLTAVRPLK